MSAALLVADPEPSVATFLERHLTDDGFEVVCVEEGDAALELAERARPDLVLLDDLDVCRRLREGEPGRSWDRDVPVIVLGRAQADAVDRVRAFARGCDDYLAKPFHYEELLWRIRAVLRRVAPPVAEILEAGEIRVDKRTRCVTAAGSRVLLPAKEYELLASRSCSRSSLTRASSRRSSARSRLSDGFGNGRRTPDASSEPARRWQSEASAGFPPTPQIKTPELAAPAGMSVPPGRRMWGC